MQWYKIIGRGISNMNMLWVGLGVEYPLVVDAILFDIPLQCLVSGVVPDSPPSLFSSVLNRCMENNGADSSSNWPLEVCCQRCGHRPSKSVSKRKLRSSLWTVMEQDGLCT